jgi:hypothetical protein
MSLIQLPSGIDYRFSARIRVRSSVPAGLQPMGESYAENRSWWLVLGACITLIVCPGLALLLIVLNGFG